jgi:hypothetical protein
MPLYDYLYADLPKVVSLHSQITAKVAGAQLAALANHVPNHALLRELETGLAEQGYLLDLSGDQAGRSLRNALLRKRLSTAMCIKVTGRAVVEDYQRIRSVADAFPDAADFLNKSVQSHVRNTDDFKQLEMMVTALSEELKENVDRDARAAGQARLKESKEEIDTAIAAATMVKEIEPWVLEGLKTWIDTFLPGVINLRIYPTADAPDEQVFGHLKREYFDGQDLNAFHFARGASPSLPLTMVGIVTALPPEGQVAFNPMAEFSREGLANAESMEHSMREVFQRFDAVDQLIRTCRFPRIMVQPLMVYRSVEGG